MQPLSTVACEGGSCCPRKNREIRRPLWLDAKWLRGDVYADDSDEVGNDDGDEDVVLSCLRFVFRVDPFYALQRCNAGASDDGDCDNDGDNDGDDDCDDDDGDEDGRQR